MDANKSLLETISFTKQHLSKCISDIRVGGGVAKSELQSRLDKLNEYESKLKQLNGKAIPKDLGNEIVSFTADSNKAATLAETQSARLSRNVLLGVLLLVVGVYVYQKMKG